MSVFELFMWINFSIIIFIIGIILSAKLMQYFRRWGISKEASNNYEVNFYEILVNNTKLNLKYYRIKNNNQSENKKLLVFTPFSVSCKRFLYFATALALNSYDVILVESRRFIKLCSKLHNPKEPIVELIQNFAPTYIIAGDMMYPILVKTTDQLNLRYVFIRPILDYTELSLFRSIPFSGRWFLVLSLRLFRINQFLKKLGTSHTIRDQINSHINAKSLMIYPKLPFRKKSVKKMLNYPNNEVYVLSSRFSFRNYETIVFGTILRFIS
ncbi:MAG: hypothetical protein JW776_03505 [Candidatus Lokiarchaeota archaeon]|nr:hypothetical protein [Candidatus Lokiarchaeota archaeon]